MLDLCAGRAAFRQSSVDREDYSSIVSVLDVIKCPAIRIDRNGSVLAVSAKASKLFDGELFVRGQHLYVTHYQSRIKLEELLNRVRLASDSQEGFASQVVIHRSDRRPIVIEAIWQDWACKSSLCDTGALLLLTDLSEMPVISQISLMEIFGLTRVQAHLARLLVMGKSLKEIAREMNISAGTARNHLKAIFVRTATKRQGELISLLSRLR
ncbi:helix-turn-helix transcriptional regulator [Bradyrhizobium sp. DASA03120]|uniref:helix-turn-helix transcriptional regulator n=1 Tax=Bradyrhizobium sp. SMVTL-02 TaxID=3395917 RepID=UPI003F70D81B